MLDNPKGDQFSEANRKCNIISDEKNKKSINHTSKKEEKKDLWTENSQTCKIPKSRARKSN